MLFADLMPLFAQARGGFNPGGAGGPPPGLDKAVLIAIVVVGLVFFAIGLAIQIMFLLTLSRALQQCAPRNRTMEPGQVWLNLIPCFGIVWLFITVNRMAESLRDEFRDRGLRSQEDYGKTIGTTYAILAVCSAIPYLGSLIAIGAIVCWIMYWVKIAGLSRELREGESFRDDEDRGYRRRYEDDADEDDDRPRRRSRKRDEDEDDEDDRPRRPKRRRDDDED